MIPGDRRLTVCGHQVRRSLLLAAVAVLAVAAPAAAFDNAAPLAAKEWYLTADKAWDYWPSQPTLAPVKVAIVDSGVDYGHPEFVGRIAGGRSFVGGTWKHDSDGHGTFVAGEIAAGGQQMAGLAFNAKLLIAKVVKPDGSVSLAGEVAAIRWAANEGARVINLSLGGVRDPLNSQLDTYSASEQAAVDYAYGKGAVVVAAVGNGQESPQTPWRYADYPAALPHVVGVSAIGPHGGVPTFSNRDAAYVDIAAPGVDIFSTVPRNLVDSSRPLCTGHPYSDCGPFEFRNAIGTSFAAPQVTAAAALLIGQDPSLTPDQVSWLLERSATDERTATGCSLCTPGRDAYTGWGRLNVDAALTALAAGQVPPPDRIVAGDNVGALAHPLAAPRTIEATLDYWDYPVDVFALALRKRERLYARLSTAAPAHVSFLLWQPGTKNLNDSGAIVQDEAARSLTVAGQLRLAFTAPDAGTYYIEVKLLARTYDPIAYTLAVAARG
jgi:subtilisin family serine protease